MKKVILKNIFSNWFVYVLIIIVTFVMTPIMLQYLGKTGYGIWLLITSLTGYLGLFDLGIQSSTTKYVAEYLAKKDENKFQTLISTTFFIFLIIAGIVLIVTIILALLTDVIFKIPDRYAEIAPYLVLVIGSQVSVLFIFATFTQVISGMQRYELHSLIETITVLVRSVLIYYFLKTGHGLLAVALIAFCSTLAARICYIFILKFLKVRLKLQLRYFDKNILKQIFNYSKISFILIIATKLIYYTDNIVIGVMVSVSGISIYGIAGRLVGYMRELVLNATNVLNPAASHSKESDRNSLRTMALYSAQFTTILITPMVIGFFIVGDSFIKLWIGGGFEETYTVLITLSIAQLFALPLYGIGSMLYGIAKHSILAKVMVTEAILNLILSLIFVKFWGIIGVALGTVVPSLFFNLFYFPLKATKLFNLSIVEYYLKCLGQPFLMAIPFAATLFFYKHTFGCNTWLQFISSILCSFIVYAIIIYQFNLKNFLPPKYRNIEKLVVNFAKSLMK